MFNSPADDVRQERYEQRQGSGRIQWPTLILLPTSKQLVGLLEEAEVAFAEDLRCARASLLYRHEYLAGFILQRLGG